jgi:hypothetical protein
VVGRQEYSKVLLQQRLRFSAVMFDEPLGQPLVNNMQKGHLRPQQVSQLERPFNGAIRAWREISRNEQVLNGLLQPRRVDVLPVL